MIGGNLFSKELTFPFYIRCKKDDSYMAFFENKEYIRIAKSVIDKFLTDEYSLVETPVERWTIVFGREKQEQEQYRRFCEQIMKVNIMVKKEAFVKMFEEIREDFSTFINELNFKENENYEEDSYFGQTGDGAVPF